MNMPIRCLAVDDEAYATKIIADYIEKVPFLELAGRTTSPIEALMMVQQGQVDLLFLDIQMPELTGIQLLKLLGGKCKVILTTAYPEYAVEGFELDVTDYLLKPFAFDRFLKAVQKVQASLQTDHPPLATPVATFAPSAIDYIFIKGESKHKFIKVNFPDILFIEGMKNYVTIYTTTQKLVTYQTLRVLEESLPQPPFCRVHKSYIISIDRIRMVDGNTVYLQEHAIPLGETYRDDFFGLIGK